MTAVALWPSTWVDGVGNQLVLRREGHPDGPVAGHARVRVAVRQADLEVCGDAVRVGVVLQDRDVDGGLAEGLRRGDHVVFRKRGLEGGIRADPDPDHGAALGFFVVLDFVADALVARGARRCEQHLGAVGRFDGELRAGFEAVAHQADRVPVGVRIVREGVDGDLAAGPDVHGVVNRDGLLVVGFRGAMPTITVPVFSAPIRSRTR